jgi:hypothetical protein
MKVYLVITFVIVCFGKLSAQNKTIKVTKTIWQVNITSPDSVLWINRKNIVNIKVMGGSNYAIHINGGTIFQRNDQYFVNVKEEGAVTISVYEKLPGKKMRVLSTKLFPVKRIPLPQIFVCGVRQDSVIDKMQIINDNVITAYHPFYKVNLPVVGFDMIVPAGKKTEKLSSNNNHFTIDMRRRIYGLKSGTLLYFENVYYILPDGSKEKTDAFQLFVSETNKYKVGYRVWGL